MSILDPVLATATQSRQMFHQFLGVPDVHMIGMNAGLDQFTDQPAGHGIGVVANVYDAATMNTHCHTFASIEPLCGQRPQCLPLFQETLYSSLVALGKQLTDELLVVATAREITAATQHQSLIEGAFEPVVTLFHITILI
jgi:hypothetical protein